MAQIIAAVVGIIGIVFFVIILGTLMGGVVGWIVNLLFPFVTVTLNALLGTTLTAFEMGAVLGFVGGFFRSSVTKKSGE
jgi:hypothetical protein